MHQEFEAVIGLEVHIQTNSKTKAFCGDSTAFGASPNAQVSAVSLAHPGTLPRINKRHVEQATLLGLSLGCTIQPITYFDRKHYFYADLPKGFQTTQDGSPICIGGTFEFMHNEKVHSIRIHHIHMEEDAGKSLHEGEQPFSQIDLNRAGVPLLEMVTEPDFRSAEEVHDFIHALRLHVQYLAISDGNMEEGSLRCDCNISVRPHGQETLNNRCEIKNVNSARFARQAINYEIQRQSKIMREGGMVDQETREFSASTGKTTLLRSKEDAHDYRYFPEPDLPPLHMSPGDIKQLETLVPELPLAKMSRFLELGIEEKDARLLVGNKSASDEFDAYLTSDREHTPRAIAKFWINQLMPQQKERSIPEGRALQKRVREYLNLLDGGKVNRSAANQKLWPVAFDSNLSLESVAKEIGILRDGSEALDLDSLVKDLIVQNPVEAEKLRRGKKGLISFFMGQVMRATGGKAEPQKVSEAIKKAIDQK
ncbi:MAG: Asp-tRNA(Asn)/Glu-tRNA(Gln) amidotransferase subunit GatB [Saprospiraceae bacterium]|nr:Asp-tRNA(Asn)/Glu-tRNA(Gln) amidotransferase subunit GatB [Saprospiraceae bacterium]